MLITALLTNTDRKGLPVNLLLLTLKLNKHEKNYFNNSSSIRFDVC